MQKLTFLLISFILASPFFATQAAEPMAAKTKTIMVLDASGSMWGQIDGKNKITIAREVIDGLVKDWKAENHLGLITYGHRKKGDCNDIEQLIAVGPINAQSYTKAVNDLNPKGKTPLTESIKRAAKQLKHEEDPATVILVTDGLETCNADPCAVSKELEESGVNFTAHVVAFDLSADEQASLKCIADNTGGLFLTADNAKDLQSALGQAAETAAVEPPGVQLHTVMKEGGKPITKDSLYYYIYNEAGEEVEGTNVNEPLIYLAPGNYTVKVRHNITYVENSFTVPESGVLDHTIVIGTGHLNVSATKKEGSKVLDTGPVWRIYSLKEDGSANKQIDFNNGAISKFVLARGKYKVRADMGETIKVWSDVEIKADETTDLLVNLNAGSLNVSSKETADGEVLKDGPVWRIYNLKEDGSANKQIDFNNYAVSKFALPQGQYKVRTDMGETIKVWSDFEIKADETTDLVVNLNAGSLSVSSTFEGKPAEGTNWYIYNMGEDGKAEGKSIDFTNYGKATFRLPAGDFILRASNNGKNINKYQKVSIEAGKTTNEVVALDEE